jgi:TRAP-type C4-dicarboxylate transport system substrate-binding protein
LLRIVTVLAFAILAACSPPASEQTGDGKAPLRPAKELIFNNYLSPGDPVRRVAIEDFGKRIEQESKGALKIVIPDSSLAPPNRQWNVVTEGVADMAIIPVYSQRARIALPMVADLPFNSVTAEAASVALWNTQQKFFDRVNEFADVKLLSLHVLPPFNYISNTKPLVKADDLKGLKIWVAAGPATDAVKAVGAIPVYSPFPQLFEYASKGNVDALMIGPGSIKTAGIGDYVKYMTSIPGGMGSASFALVMNKDRWAALSDAEQAAVTRAAQGLPRITGRALDERNQIALQEIKLTINDADEVLLASLRKQLQGMETAWMESARQRGLPDPTAALAYYREQMSASPTAPTD